MSGGIRLFVCFAILATLTIAESEAIAEDKNRGPSTKVTPPRPLYEKDGFLAGEETPVWLASYDYGVRHRVQRTLTRLHDRRLPMVKRAMNHWKSIKNRSGFPIRKMRSVDRRGNFTSTEQFHDALRNAKNDGFDSPNLVEKRSADSNEVVIYPSILVVMDYHDVFPTADKKSSWSVEQLVLYALAFWGTVDSSLRNVQNPKVSLSIAGIVITKKRLALPYMTEANNENLFVRGLSPMINHWRSVSKARNSELPIGSYDIVVHMTDIYPWSAYKQWTALAPPNNPHLDVATEGPPCKFEDQIGGLIIHDDLTFNGVHRAVVAMIRALGGSAVIPASYGHLSRYWTKEMVDTLSNVLKDASCMSAPKHHYRPGTPVAPILAGELLPNGKQCEVHQYEQDAWTCWDTSMSNRKSNCVYLYCSNQHVWGVTCSEVGLTLDGSFCNAENTKICLDGRCVDKI